MGTAHWCPRLKARRGKNASPVRLFVPLRPFSNFVVGGFLWDEYAVRWGVPGDSPGRFLGKLCIFLLLPVQSARVRQKPLERIS